MEIGQLGGDAVLAAVVDWSVERGAGRALEGLVELVEDGQQEDREDASEAAGHHDQHVGQIF